MDPAEGQVARAPDLRAGHRGGKDRTADVVGAHQIDLAALDDGYHRAVEFGEAVAVGAVAL